MDVLFGVNLRASSYQRNTAAKLIHNFLLKKIKKIVEHQSFLWGNWYPFWTSGVLKPGWIPLFACRLLHCLHLIDSAGSPLVWHLSTPLQSAWKPSYPILIHWWILNAKGILTEKGQTDCIHVNYSPIAKTCGGLVPRDLPWYDLMAAESYKVGIS